MCDGMGGCWCEQMFCPYRGSYEEYTPLPPKVKAKPLHLKCRLGSDESSISITDLDAFIHASPEDTVVVEVAGNQTQCQKKDLKDFSLL